MSIIAEVLFYLKDRFENPFSEGDQAITWAMLRVHAMRIIAGE